jgi:hypothetical protein
MTSDGGGGDPAAKSPVPPRLRRWTSRSPAPSSVWGLVPSGGDARPAARLMTHDAAPGLPEPFRRRDGRLPSGGDHEGDGNAIASSGRPSAHLLGSARGWPADPTAARPERSARWRGADALHTRDRLSAASAHHDRPHPGAPRVGSPSLPGRGAARHRSQRRGREDRPSLKRHPGPPIHDRRSRGPRLPNHPLCLV